MPKTLNNMRLEDAAKAVAGLDDGMAAILENHGTPPLWDRQPGFETLIRIILEQQVSLVSADAMYRRLQKNIQPITPESIITAGEMHLRSFGVTRQKASYFVNVAIAIQSGELDLIALAKDEDETAIEKLTAVKGVGPWTAKIYLLMVLCRPDVWPVGDVALATAVKNLRGLNTRPTQAELSEIAKSWRPHRATAARLLWHYYLNGM